MDIPIENNVSAKVYKNDPIRRMIITSIIIAMYAIALPFCYYTAGEPRRTAMIQAQKIADEKWAAGIQILPQETNDTASNPLNQIIYDDEDSPGVSVDKLFAELNGAGVSTSSGGNSATGSFIDEFGEGSDEYGQASPKTEGSAASSSFLASWLGPAKEQRRQKQEFDKWQKELQEKSGESVILPPEYLPSAWACLALFMCLSLHALFHLMCHWVVRFKATSLYKAADKVEEGCFVLITPPANRGFPQLVPIKKSAASGITTPFAEFQRLKYIYLPSAKLGDQSKKYPGSSPSLLIL